MFFFFPHLLILVQDKSRTPPSSPWPSQRGNTVTQIFADTWKWRCQFENQMFVPPFDCFPPGDSVLLNYVKNEASSWYQRGDEWKFTDVSLLSWQCDSNHSKGWDFFQLLPFFFSHPMMSVLFVLFCFHFIGSDSQKAVSDCSSAFGMFSFFFNFMMNMYVPLCMSFWYILWILIVWMSMKALPCTVFFFFSYLVRTSCILPESRLHPIFPPLYEMECLLLLGFFCFLEEFSRFIVCVLCSDLMVLNTPFHCTVTLKSPFVFLLSDGFC